MGNFMSEFKNNRDYTVSEKSHPTKDDWITEHASATGLAVVEVERLWDRFKILGCTNEGILPSDIIKRPPASEDIFVKNILVTFRELNGSITFQTFCNAMKWAEDSTVEVKMKAIFNMLNNGNNVSKDLLVKVLKRIYPTSPDREIKETTDYFMEQMDKRRTGTITQQQFVAWGNTMPRDELEEVLEFDIIPAHINEEAHRTFTSQALSTQPPQTRLFPVPRSRLPPPTSPDMAGDLGKRIPNDALLQKVAAKVVKYDWRILGNSMGYTELQLQGLEKKYADNKQEQVFSLLKTWRKREGEDATYENLEQLLTSCRMNDAAMLLF